MTPTAAETIDRIQLLASLSKRTRRKLAEGVMERRYNVGDALSTVDGDGFGFFLIAEGTATVMVNDSPRRTIGPGDYFGELALITGEPRSAAIRAGTDMVVYVIAEHDFKPLVRENPDVAWGLLDLLAHRLRELEV